MRDVSAASAAPVNRWSKVLKQRLLTAAVLIPLFVWAVLGLPTPYFAALLAVVVLIAAAEWGALVQLPQETRIGFVIEVAVLLLLALLWAADSGAYFSARRYGRRKLAPRVSPGKTWEGVAGGMAAALVVAVIGARIFDMSFAATGAFMILCGLVVVISVVGDLVESLFKREAGVKDSGRFLPGHGGALDRIDSLTAAAPLFYLGVILIRRFT